MLNRRVFLKAGGLSLLSFGAGPAFLARAAQAVGAAAAPHPLAAGGRRKVLVTLFQRGAMDGLAAVPLLSDPVLGRLRPRLALSAARSAGDDRLIDLDGRFGLHPALTPLERLWRDGRLAVVHAVGSPDPTRSHFDAQDYMETGTPGNKGTRSGWLNRVAGALGHDATPFRAVAVTPSLPRSLYGPASSLAIADLADFRVRAAGRGGDAGAAGKGFEALYRETSEELLRDAGSDTFEAVHMLSDKAVTAYRPTGGARYPRGPLGDSLRQIAMLIKTDVGLEVAFAESGGWDTHVQQGALQGSFARRATDLAESIAAFWTDLGPHRDQVVLMTMTEFGRTVAENGSGGTDHGHGSCLFLLGNEVAGGRVYGDLPGLDRDQLYEGRDLPVTTDFRDVFSETARRHLAIGSDAEIFPGWRGRPVGLFRAA